MEQRKTPSEGRSMFAGWWWMANDLLGIGNVGFLGCLAFSVGSRRLRLLFLGFAVLNLIGLVAHVLLRRRSAEDRAAIAPSPRR